MANIEYQSNHQPTLKLSSEEISLLQMCIALVLGGVFRDKVEAEKILTIFKNKPGKLERLYSKLEYARKKKYKLKQIEEIEAAERLKSNLNASGL